MIKTGIVLSGGGVRGFAHLGFLKLLDEIGLKQCTIYLEPDLHRFNMFDVKKADEIFDIGYTTAVRLRPQLEKLLLQD